MAVQLPRMSFDNPDIELKRQRTELAEKARTLFGYTGWRIPGKEVMSSLGDTLKRLGIQPLQHEAVLAYKAEKARVLIRTSTFIGVGVLTAATAACTYGLIAKGALAIGCFISSVLMVIFGLNFLYNKSWRSTYREYKWVRTPLGYYRRMVPEPALLMAVQVRENDANVEMYVDELVYVVKDDRPIRTHPDPFLVATKGKEEYYLDVWDEAEFKNKL
jgi:hypothetical protein